MKNSVPLDDPRRAFCLSKASLTLADGGEKDMFSKTEAKQLINDLFEEEALVLGGLVAVHQVDDDLVWRLVKNLDVIRGKALRRLDARDTQNAHGGVAARPDLKPHPAIEDFLFSIRRA
jgi:hypothetical protein